MITRVRPSFVAALAITALLGLYATTASAASGVSQINWTNPTTYEDGSALAASEITGYTFTCTFTPTGSSTAQACGGFSPVSISTGAQSTAQTNLTYPAQGGVACFRVIVKVGLVSSDPSDLTAASCKQFAALKPSKATGVVVVVTVATNAQGRPVLRLVENK